MSGVRVLVVDDNSTAIEIYTSMMKGFDCEVLAAGSAAEAMKILKKSIAYGDKIDLALVDWRMPQVDGLGLIHMVNTQLKEDKPLMIMSTAFDGQEIEQKALDAGVSAFLPKPINQSVLFDTMANILHFNKDHTRSAPKRPRPTNTLKFSKNRILLVEDNVLNQQVATEFLVDMGLDVELAVNGKIAVDMVQKGAYELVLMDVHMPVMDGLDATRSIRSLGSFEKLPILAMTAHAVSGSEQETRSAGMNGYLTKPIKPDEIFTAISEWIGAPKEESSPVQEGQAQSASVFVETLKTNINFDVEKAIVRLKNKTKLYDRMITQFIYENKDALQQVKAYKRSNDLVGLHRFAHSLGTTAYTIGAYDLSFAAKILEEKLNNKEKSFTFEYDQMCAQLEAVMSFLQTMVDAHEKSHVDGIEIDQAQVMSQLSDLRQALENDDALCSNICAELTAYLPKGTLRDILLNVQILVDDIEYEDALAALAAIENPLNMDMAS